MAVSRWAHDPGQTGGDASSGSAGPGTRAAGRFTVVAALLLLLTILVAVNSALAGREGPPPIEDVAPVTVGPRLLLPRQPRSDPRPGPPPYRLVTRTIRARARTDHGAGVGSDAGAAHGCGDPTQCPAGTRTDANDDDDRDADNDDNGGGDDDD